MTHFHTRKPIDNTRLVRMISPVRLREMARLLVYGALVAGVFLLYAWQHFEYIQMRYQLESLKSEHAQAAELNRELKLEVAGLRAPSRIDEIARQQLGLTVPVPGQMAPLETPGEPELAELGTAGPTRTR